MIKCRLAIAVAFLFVVATYADMARAADETSDKQMTPLSLRLNWKMKGEFAPLVVAAKKGFFAEQGLDVQVNEGSGATQALQTVASGQDDIAYVPSVQLIKAVNKGMPVKAVATVVKIDPMGMVSKSNVALAKPTDLEGRTVEISPASTFSQIWEAFAEKNKIDVSKVNVVRAAPSARFNLLLSGKVDVLADIFITNEYPVLEAKAGKLNVLRVGDWGFRLLGYTLVANQALLDEKPDLIKRFNAAAMKGFQFTLDNPGEAAAIAVEAYPDALQAETTRGQLTELVDFLKRGKPSQLFVGDDEGWAGTLEILKNSGVISEQKPVDTYYTNAFVPGAS